MIPSSLASFVKRGRDNNFTLIRFCAAMLVLFSHSFALSLGTGRAEPLRGSLGMTFGTLAVDIFFITSGFLVTKSLLVRQSLFDFTTARMLRIYPGLIVSVLATVALCGVYFTDVDLHEFLRSGDTVRFIKYNCLSFMSVSNKLPGVFLNNPYKNAVNGSLWTLPIELKMYLSLAVLWVVVVPFTKTPARVVKPLTLVVAVASGLLYVKYFGIRFQEKSILRLMALFYAGGSYYVLRGWIPLWKSLFLAAAVLLPAAALISREAFFVAHMLASPYLVLYLAFVPSGFIRKFNHFGDYSYGLYIYGFPVQQMVMAALPGSSPMRLFAASSLLTFLFAFLSWNLVEEFALKQKGRITFLTSKLRLAGGSA